jgi:SAM-dependent methyltransferase
MSAYQQKLIADGMPQAEAEALVADFQSRAPIDPDFQAATFNRIYSRSEDNASRTVLPNAFLVETIADRRPGKALDLGMGLGRNTIFLAQKGWDATGIDLSNIGVNKAVERARSLGVHINALVADVNRFDLGTNQWDLICLLYFAINEGMPNLRQRLATALKPGGLVIAEGFGLPVIDTLLAERANWEPTKLKLLRMEYRQGASDWGGNEIGRLLLQKTA